MVISSTTHLVKKKEHICRSGISSKSVYNIEGEKYYVIDLVKLIPDLFLLPDTFLTVCVQ